jgi:hypothetical protein
MAICVRCKKDVGIVGGLFYNSKTKRCGNCEKEVKQGLDAFRRAFLKFCEDGVIAPDEWQRLQRGSANSKLVWEECLEYVRVDALHHLERVLAFASADGIITSEEEQFYGELKAYLQIPAKLAEPLDRRMEYLKRISEIRQGRLPVVQPSVHMESNEICHLETPATFVRILKASVQKIEGRFIATNQKLHYLSSQGGWIIPWKNVMRVECEIAEFENEKMKVTSTGEILYLELSTKKGNGYYIVDEPKMTVAILDTITRVSKRQMLIPQEDIESRQIPQQVKTAVWQRDQGKCAQCGATSYLEFDHIIPFSKGGASTVNNVQLLCRKCNLQKADKI